MLKRLAVTTIGKAPADTTEFEIGGWKYSFGQFSLTNLRYVGFNGSFAMNTSNSINYRSLVGHI